MLRSSAHEYSLKTHNPRDLNYHPEVRGEDTMAGSRLPNFGTIFSRTTGLLETGGLKEVPIWYNVYKKYRPNPEPDRNRPPAPQDPIPEIVYKEDFQRAEKARPRDARMVCNFFEDANQNKTKT